MTVVYVVSTARSGSTIIGRSLAERANYAFVGETKFFPTRLLEELPTWTCSCGRSPQHDCAVWSPVYRRLLCRLDDHRLQSLQTGYRRNGIVVRHRLDALVDELEDIYRQLWERTGTALVDTSKDIVIARALAERGVDVRLLHVVRDPRAVDFSRRQRPVKGFVRGNSLRVAGNWLSVNCRTSALARELGHAHRIRYEDFCADAEATMAGTVKRLRLLPGDVDVADGLVHDFASNPRLRSRERHHGLPEIRLDREWETDLPIPARLAVTTLTRPLLRRYGYPAGSSG